MKIDKNLVLRKWRPILEKTGISNDRLCLLSAMME